MPKMDKFELSETPEQKMPELNVPGACYRKWQKW